MKIFGLIDKIKTIIKSHRILQLDMPIENLSIEDKEILLKKIIMDMDKSETIDERFFLLCDSLPHNYAEYLTYKISSYIPKYNKRVSNEMIDLIEKQMSLRYIDNEVLKSYLFYYKSYPYANFLDEILLKVYNDLSETEIMYILSNTYGDMKYKLIDIFLNNNIDISFYIDTLEVDEQYRIYNLSAKTQQENVDFFERNYDKYKEDETKKRQIIELISKANELNIFNSETYLYLRILYGEHRYSIIGDKYITKENVINLILKYGKILDEKGMLQSILDSKYFDDTNINSIKDYFLALQIENPDDSFFDSVIKYIDESIIEKKNIISSFSFLDWRELPKDEILQKIKQHNKIGFFWVSDIFSVEEVVELFKNKELNYSNNDLIMLAYKSIEIKTILELWNYNESNAYYDLINTINIFLNEKYRYNRTNTTYSDDEYISDIKSYFDCCLDYYNSKEYKETDKKLNITFYLNYNAMMLLHDKYSVLIDFIDFSWYRTDELKSFFEFFKDNIN